MAAIENGVLNPDWIVALGGEECRRWIRSRLRYDDPYLPAPIPSFEFPSDLIIEFLKKKKPGGEAYQILAGEVISLIQDLHNETRGDIQRFRGYAEELLRICEFKHLPPLDDWFLYQVEALAHGKEEFESTWRDKIVATEIIRIAAVRVPVSSYSMTRYKEGWNRIVELPEYSELALIAFGPSFHDVKDVIVTWWNVGKKESHIPIEFLVRQSIKDGLERADLKKLGEGWPQSMRDAISEIYSNLTGHPLFEDDTGPDLFIAAESYLLSCQSRYNNNRRSDKTKGKSDDIRDSIYLFNSDYGSESEAKNLISSVNAEVQRSIEDVHANNLKYFDDSSFRLLDDGYINIKDSCVYNYPFYLTDVKRNFGFGVLPYGKQRRLGIAYNTKTNFLSPQEKIDLKTFIDKALLRGPAKVVTLENYAIDEILFQQIDELTKGRDPIKQESIRKFSMPKGNIRKVPKYIPDEVDQDHKTFFFFDLGDKRRVENHLRAEKNNRFRNHAILEIGHEMDIDVGIGYSQSMSLRLSEKQLWRQTIIRVLSVLKKWNEPGPGVADHAMGRDHSPRKESDSRANCVKLFDSMGIDIQPALSSIAGSSMGNKILPFSSKTGTH